MSGRRLNSTQTLTALAVVFAVSLAFAPAVAGEAAVDVRQAFAPSATDLMPLKTTEGTFLAVEGKDKGEHIKFSITDDMGRWILDKHGRISHVLERTADGSIAIVSEEDRIKGLEVTYDPPVLFLPSRGEYGKLEHGESKVIARDIETGRVKYRGKCDYTVKILRPRAVNTPAGEFQAYIVEARRKLDLGVPSIDLGIDFAFAPGTGLVAETVRQKVSAAFGLWRQESAWRWELDKSRTQVHAKQEM